MLLDHNRGKAEAVRIGMCHARAQGKQYVGYWDSDLSTPLNEILDFMVCCTKSILFFPLYVVFFKHSNELAIQ